MWELVTVENIFFFKSSPKDVFPIDFLKEGGGERNIDIRETHIDCCHPNWGQRSNLKPRYVTSGIEPVAGPSVHRPML